MKAVVFAYHNIGCVGLQSLLDAGVDVVAVVTHEDDPDENVWFDSVAKLAHAHQLPVFTPDNPNNEDFVAHLAALKPDLLFSFYYRYMLKRPLLDLPSVAALNLHGSYLPAYRGRCPVNWVLVKGESETGVTLHHMVEKPDAGDIVGQRKVPIADDDTALTLYGKMTEAAGVLMAETLPLLLAGKAPRIAQDQSRASYYGGRRPADGRFDWSGSARDIYNLVRAVTHPYPGAFVEFGGKQLLVWWALPHLEAHSETPGTVTDIGADYLTVATGQGQLRLLSVQVDDGPILNGRSFADQFGLVAGDNLMAPDAVAPRR